MAFRILTEEELARLTDKRKEQYKKELNIYNLRAAFVAQLEKYEDVKIEPYKPKLKPIAVIDKREFKAYQRQEYKAKLQKPIKKPEMQLNVVEINKTENINLPKVSVQAVEIRPVNIENNKPILPKMTKPVLSVIYFKKPEVVQPDLPVIAKPECASTSFQIPEKPQIELPMVDTSFVLPALSTDGFKIDAMKKPSNIPSVKTPNIAVPAFVPPEKEIPNLPLVTVAGPAAKSFSKPEKIAVELPTVSGAKAPLKPIKIDTPAVQLPQTHGVSVPVKSFEKPEIPMSGLPEVARPVIAVSSFQSPEVKELHLPSTAVTPPVSKAVKPVKIGKINITTPQFQGVAVNSFSKIENNYAGVPKQIQANIPDARLALDKVFTALKEEASKPVGRQNEEQ